MRILKYELKTTNVQSFPMQSHQVLKVESQGNKICLWVIVDEQSEEREVTFNMLGTGWVIDNISDWHYIGSCQHPPFVWHFFKDVPDFVFTRR